MFVLGITGNSGGGKSTLSKILFEKNAYIIDADVLARRVLDIDVRAYGETVEFFGDSILNFDKTINRKALSDIVFGDKDKLSALSEITHKHILNYIYDEIEEISEAGCHSLIVVDAPLLFESGLDGACDAVWVVDAIYETKISRIMERDGISREKAAQRLEKQTPPEELVKRADHVIMNDFGLDYLVSEVEGMLLEFGLGTL